MYIIGTGLLGFFLLFLYDLASLRGARGRAVLALAGYSLHAAALALAVLTPEKTPLPTGLSWLGMALAALGGWWLSHCLIFHPSVWRTYWEKPENLLSDQGPYALCRHPGLWGYLFLLAGLNLVRPSQLLAVASTIWLSADLGHILLQDRWVFPRQFPGYEAYSRRTPMLIPSRHSLRRFWRTRGANHQEGVKNDDHLGRLA